MTSIRARLVGVVALFACGLATLVVVLSWMDGAATYDTRRNELKTFDEIAYKVVEQQYDEFTNGKLTENEAKERAKNTLRHIHFDATGYFFVCDDNVVFIVHGGQPSKEGIDQTTQVDLNGKYFTRDMRDVAVAHGEGFVDYYLPKPGSDQSSQKDAFPKVSFMKRFAPWGWNIGTGVYLDEVAAQVWRKALIASSIGLAFLILIGGVAAIVIFNLTRRLRAVSGAVVALAQGRSDVAIPPVTSDDEIGELAAAVQVFKENAVALGAAEKEKVHLGAAAADEQRRAAAEAIATERATVVTSVGAGMTELAKGNLTYRMPDGMPAEYNKLQSDFNGAIDKLKETMLSVISSTEAIQSGTQEISTAADDLSRRTEHQAASLEETAAALGAITATVKKSADGAMHARSVVAAADENAKQSTIIVRQAVEAMDAIAKSSNQIGQIIGVIDEIAFQTNLLALNAGVEAARAGDAGRGFAVVASEVRALAQRSADAAKEIKGLITASATQVGQGVKLVAETGKSLERIMAQVSEINAVVGEIADGAKEQATGLAEVNIAIDQMDQVTQQNAAMVEESTAASRSLSEETSELSQLVGRFQVGRASGDETMRRELRKAAPHAFKPAAKPAAAKAPRATPKAVVNGAPAKDDGGWTSF